MNWSTFFGTASIGTTIITKLHQAYTSIHFADDILIYHAQEGPQLKLNANCIPIYFTYVKNYWKSLNTNKNEFMLIA